MNENAIHGAPKKGENGGLPWGSALRQSWNTTPNSKVEDAWTKTQFMCPPLSSAKPLVTGKYVLLLFSRSVPSPNMCICVYVYYIRCSYCCLYFVLCRRKKRSRDESRHREKGRTDEISVLSLLSSYLRWEVSKEGQLSYPNFVWGLLLDDMQPWRPLLHNKWSPETS